jgi:hypothetical protein
MLMVKVKRNVLNLLGEKAGLGALCGRAIKWTTD